MTQWGLDALFNPAKRHMDDEKLRLQSTREEVGDNSGGKRIDLESGKVVIIKVDETEDAPAASKSASSKSAASKSAASAKGDDELTPAQRRARERRRRAAH